MGPAWNEQERSFAQFFGSDAVDASSLMMPLMLFVSPKDPRMLSTIGASAGNLEPTAWCGITIPIPPRAMFGFCNIKIKYLLISSFS